MKLYFLFILFLSIFLISCSKKTSEIDLKIDNLSIFAEGELYEGSNSAQCEFESPLNAFLKEKGLTIENLVSASVSECELSVADSNNFNIYSSISMQLTSEKVEMQNIGVLNPVPENVNTILIKTAEKQDNILQLLKENKIFAVADANIKKDTAMNIDLKLKMTFKIKYNTK